MQSTVFWLQQVCLWSKCHYLQVDVIKYPKVLYSKHCHPVDLSDMASPSQSPTSPQRSKSRRANHLCSQTHPEMQLLLSLYMWGLLVTFSLVREEVVFVETQQERLLVILTPQAWSCWTGWLQALARAPVRPVRTGWITSSVPWRASCRPGVRRETPRRESSTFPWMRGSFGRNLRI